MLSQKGICGFIFALCCTGALTAPTPYTASNELYTLNSFAKELLETFEKETDSFEVHLLEPLELTLPQCNNATSWNVTGNRKILKVFGSILEVLENTIHAFLSENVKRFITKNLVQLKGYLGNDTLDVVTDRNWMEAFKDKSEEKLGIYCILMTYRNCTNFMVQPAQFALVEKRDCSRRKHWEEYESHSAQPSVLGQEA